MNALAKLLWLVVALLLFCFALLAVNQGRIALQFLMWKTPEVSVFWWLLTAFLLGGLLSGLLFGLASLRLRLRQHALNKQLDDSRAEVQKLRNLTLQD